MIGLQEFLFEAKTYTEFKREILKTLGITSWERGDWKNGIGSKIGIEQIKEPSASAKKRGQFTPLSYLVNKDYDKLCITPWFSYVQPSEYKSKVIDNLGKLAKIEGCSYQLINSDKEYNDILNISGKEAEYTPRDSYPMVIISVPKDNVDKPELEGIPVATDDDTDNSKSKKDKSKTSKLPNDIKGFWCTGAGSESVDYIAYGAYGDKWTPNFARIQKHIGENKFTRYYVKLTTKKFNSYKAMKTYLKKKFDSSKYSRYSEFHIADEEKVIDSSRDERYYILTV